MPHGLAGYGLPIGLFRFRILPVQPLFVPAVNKTNMLRGAFGTVFRRLCCVPTCSDARKCPLNGTCPYKNIFEPSPPPESDRLSRNQDIPRPFVFRAPETTKTRFAPGEEFDFGLVLIGRAMDHLPYFVLAFRELAAGGIGLNRAKCELKRVEEETVAFFGSHRLQCVENDSKVKEVSVVAAPIYSSTDQVFHTPKGIDLEAWISNRTASVLNGNNSDAEMPLTLRFLTPTLLKAEHDIVRKPEFHVVFKRLRDRINALSTFFGTGPLDMDFAGLGQRAEHVRTVSCDVRWEERFRTSSKTRQRHDLSGFVGEAVYRGDLQEFLPWLVLGELVHLGKHTAWGMGQMNLISGSMKDKNGIQQ